MPSFKGIMSPCSPMVSQAQGNRTPWGHPVPPSRMILSSWVSLRSPCRLPSQPRLGPGVMRPLSLNLVLPRHHSSGSWSPVRAPVGLLRLQKERFVQPADPGSILHQFCPEFTYVGHAGESWGWQQLADEGYLRRGT